MIILRYFHRHLGDSVKVTLGSKGPVRESESGCSQKVGGDQSDRCGSRAGPPARCRGWGGAKEAEGIILDDSFFLSEE